MPKPKVTIKSLDEAPEALREYYVPEGDEFVLDVDGSQYQSRIREFRTNNIDLSNKYREASEKAKKVEQLEAKAEEFKDIDPKAAREALEQVRKLKEGELLKDGKLDELFNQRTEQLRKDHGSQIEALNKQLEQAQTRADSLQSQLSTRVINDDVQRTVLSVASPETGAMADILSRATSVWKLNPETYQPEPRGADGQLIYGKDAKEPISMKEWAENLVQEAPHLFSGNAGGGSQGSRHRGNGARHMSFSEANNPSEDQLQAIAGGGVEFSE